METIDYNLTQQYISDDSELCEEINELIQANQTILLVAPQGVGKTSFMNKYYNEKTVFIFPTVALAEQNARDTSYSLMRGVTEQTKTITNSSRFNEPLSSCLITTFQSSKSLWNLI